MVLYAGTRWRLGEPEEAWVLAEGGRILDEGRGRPRTPGEPALLLDGLWNYHTHIGDSFLRGEALPRDLAALVDPVRGYKQRRLAEAQPHEIRNGITTYLDEAARLGVRGLLDFREQGLPGVRLLREAAASRTQPHAWALARPTRLPPEVADVDAVVAAADGLGIPSLSDYGADACRLLAGAARRHAKPLALHASEGTRETMEDILALGPSLLIHLSSAARADLRLVADAGVPVAVCPTSNAFFGLRPPVEALESLGVEWYLGTDNAMLGGIDPVEEARWVLGRFPNLPPDRAWRAITTPPWKVINGLPHDASPGAGVASVRVLPLGAGGGVRWDVPPILLER